MEAWAHGRAKEYQIPTETRYFRTLKLAWDFKEPAWSVWCPGQPEPFSWHEDLTLMIDALASDPDTDDRNRSERFPVDPALGG